MWRVSRVNLYWLRFFFLDFSMTFFLLVSFFYIELFVLKLCHFFLLFLLFGYFESGLVELTRIGSWVFLCFFYWTLVFLLCHPFEILFFFLILISYHRLLVHQVNSSWLKFSSSALYFFKFFFSSLTLGYLVLNFTIFFTGSFGLIS